jgi:hypothetical protein
MTTPEHRAEQLLELYAREVGGAHAIPGQARLHELITDAIHKAVIDDREQLREKLPCASGERCGFEMCAHHKALIAAVLAVQEGRAPAPRSLFSRPLDG